MTSTTRALVWGATEPVPSFSTRETTAIDTPASRATSRMVARLCTGASYCLMSTLLIKNVGVDVATVGWYKNVTVTTLPQATKNWARSAGPP